MKTDFRDYEWQEHLDRPHTRNKQRSEPDNTTIDRKIWRVPMDKDQVQWLTETHGPQNKKFLSDFIGWSVIFDYTWMDEKIYLFYSLRYT